jgi:signal transduction histidine kinase
MQEAMIQTEKMMTVGGLAAGMAHEINSPLSGILQGVQNTVRRVSPEVSLNQEVAARCGVDLVRMQAYLKERGVFSFLSGIQESGTRAARIIRNMLQFSRQSDAIHLSIDLNDLIDRALELAATDYDLKKKHDFRGIKLERQFDRSLTNVPCIPTEIEQVALNIIKNAAEAMSDHPVPGNQPTLVVRTSREEEWARIEIEDNGPGMDAAVQRRVFEPFFTTKGVGTGTGLGLSIAYFIVTNNHHGTIDMESTVGRGTRFIIRLPLEHLPSR